MGRGTTRRLESGNNLRQWERRFRVGAAHQPTQCSLRNAWLGIQARRLSPGERRIDFSRSHLPGCRIRDAGRNLARHRQAKRFMGVAMETLHGRTWTSSLRRNDLPSRAALGACHAIFAASDCAPCEQLASCAPRSPASRILRRLRLRSSRHAGALPGMRRTCALRDTPGRGGDGRVKTEEGSRKRRYGLINHSPKIARRNDAHPFCSGATRSFTTSSGFTASGSHPGSFVLFCSHHACQRSTLGTQVAQD